MMPMHASASGTTENPNRCLEIGGLRILLKFDRNAADEGVMPEENPRQIIFHVREGPFPTIRNKTKVFDSGSNWALFTSGGQYHLQDDTLSSPRTRPETLIRFAPNLRGGEIYLRHPVRDEGVYADLFGHPVNQILMVLLLAPRRGILVHACGIDDNGRGYLFLGNSTHGKSTMARIWHDRGATVLNDDRIVVRERNGVFRMYGTPWHGTFAETSANVLPVERIFFLKKGKGNRLVAKTGTDAVSSILTRSFPPLWDPEAMERALAIMARMAGALPCGELHFLPDGRVVDFIRGMDRR